ncbi:hypothetical protein [Roseateles depolymerans]|uniref:Uncharacterized protein n=1 Tax=Roseateles depolymerans TaxID=76731 RepID=A0A0U3LEE3_9BURK|nr:hypothetical protein [Roseateles depolymerans]ALV04834.1 hypothetical protein RD2015_331 [Roseateles depolymerans]REG15154.1 hypothetical protein DES44_3660 [Roseateles depolymerans]
MREYQEHEIQESESHPAPDPTPRVLCLDELTEVAGGPQITNDGITPPA